MSSRNLSDEDVKFIEQRISEGISNDEFFNLLKARGVRVAESFSDCVKLGEEMFAEEGEALEEEESAGEGEWELTVLRG